MMLQCVPVRFKLLNPVHIGYLPNQPGTVMSPTRCYVPGKTMWGAVTAALTRRMYELPTPENFRQVGNKLKGCLYFSYLFVSDMSHCYAPRYDREQGLMWGPLAARVFYARFIGARVSTSISPTGGAKRETLHEIEFIRAKTGNGDGASKPVSLTGIVLIDLEKAPQGWSIDVSDGAIMINGIDIFSEIALGGERNYGFGRVTRQVASEIGETPFAGLDLKNEVSLGNDRPLLGHLVFHSDHKFFGDIEILAGREYPTGETGNSYINPGRYISYSGYWLAPGTVIRSEGSNARMDHWGRFEWVGT